MPRWVHSKTDSSVDLLTSWIFIGSRLRSSHPYGLRRRYEAPPAIAAWKLAACCDIILVFLGWNKGLVAVVMQALNAPMAFNCEPSMRRQGNTTGELARHCWRFGDGEVLYSIISSCFKRAMLLEYGYCLTSEARRKVQNRAVVYEWPFLWRSEKPWILISAPTTDVNENK